MAIEIVPEWMANLDDEDLSFIKNFILSSGSLKEIAKQYEVTYPTVRLRLDRLIQKIQISEDNANELYVCFILICGCIGSMVADIFIKDEE